NAGTSDSLIVGMPLVTSDGLIGKIVHTASYYSQVMPFYNSLFRVSARVQENQANGIVSWSGEANNELVMNFVPQTIPVDTGFVIETSGFSNQYPPGIPIGKVTRTEAEEGRETQRIYIEPFVILSEIDKGFVIEFRPDSNIAKLKQNYDEFFE
ncbi:MAG: rod shape-determining protein MreC, partial [Balneolaceae bacterium]